MNNPVTCECGSTYWFGGRHYTCPDCARLLPIDTLISLLEDPDRDVRIGAAWALGDVQDSLSIMPLLRYFDGSSARVVDAAAYVVQAEPTSAKQLDAEVSFLRESQPDFGVAAVEALARFQDVKILISLLGRTAFKSKVLRIHTEALVALYIEKAAVTDLESRSVLKKTCSVFSFAPKVVKDAARAKLRAIGEKK